MQHSPIYQPLPELNIHLRNPTERTIKIISIQFIDKNKMRWKIPNHWQDFREVPPHDKCTLSLSLDELQDWAKKMKVPNPENGKFIITDALDYEYQTLKLGNISLEPVDKI